jgi:hypothetical protein
VTALTSSYPVVDGGVNVYVSKLVDGLAGIGKECTSMNQVAFLAYECASHALLHELGHAMSLSQAMWEPDNIMCESAIAPSEFAEGQIIHMHFHVASVLNNPSMIPAPTETSWLPDDMLEVSAE